MALPGNISKLKPSWVDEFRAFIMRALLNLFRSLHMI
jgi:hypothetical protein